MAVQVLLRPVGYWTQRPGDGLPDPRTLMSMRWERDRRSIIAAYLGNAPVLDMLPDRQACLICGAESGRRERTDGAWRWPESLAHYVASHGVKIPPEFVQHMEQEEFRPPKVDVKHLRDQLAPTDPKVTKLISQGTAAAALDEMMSDKPLKRPKRKPSRSAEGLEDVTDALPVAVSWTASVRGVPTKPQKIQFDRPIVLGRDRTCDVVLEHSSVSRRHARFVPAHDRVIVQDLESQNGVWKNRKRCSGQVEVKDGEEVSLGQATITLLR